MAMVEQQPPIICRINRLDNVVRHLEEMSRGSRRSSWESSSSPSTCSDGRSSSSPRSLQESFKHCRPLDDVVSETRHKGNLLYRLSHLEDRVLEVCLQMEKEMMEQRRNSNVNGGNLQEDHHQPSTPTKKLKQFVKSCVKSKSKSRSKSKSKTKS